MEKFVKDNKFVPFAVLMEGLPSKVSKKFFNDAEFSGVCKYSSSFYMAQF